MRKSTKHMLRTKLDEFRTIMDNEYDIGCMERKEFVPMRDAFRILYISLGQTE